MDLHVFCLARIQHDLTKKDVYVFPVALLVLLLVFRSLRLLLLAAYSLVLGLALAMGLMYPISRQVNIVAFAPSIMGMHTHARLVGLSATSCCWASVQFACASCCLSPHMVLSPSLCVCVCVCV